MTEGHDLSELPVLERCLAEFKSAWQTTAEPDIESFIPRQGDEDCYQSLARLIAVDIDYTWRSARGKTLEEYLKRWPDLAHREAILVELLDAECLARSTYSSTPTKEELRGRFPDIATAIHLDEIAKHAADIRVAESYASTERFFVIRKVGAGGMGVVYEALDRQRNARVAIKELPTVDADGVYYFKREFRSLSEIVHPNLAALHELFADVDHWFFSMEFIDGTDFKNYMRQRTSEVATERFSLQAMTDRPQRTTITAERTSKRIQEHDGPMSRPPVVDYDELRHLLRQLADGVTALHAANTLHRDLKPSNVMVKANGQLVILDFGLATRLYPRMPFSPNDHGKANLSSKHALTTDQSIVGTSAYMSPEQAAGMPLTEATDWYAIGVMLYESLTGVRPFIGYPEDVRRHKQTRDPLPPNALHDKVPDAWNTLCLRLLCRDVGRRANGRDIVSLLRQGNQSSVVVSRALPKSFESLPAPFVGRSHQLAILQNAYTAAMQGRAVTAHVSGQSGVGKSRLVQHYLQILAESDNVIVLQGRCYESESVPYKALDTIVDSLVAFLDSLPKSECEELLPYDIAALARVFPVLNRVKVVSDAAARGVKSPDLVELRRQAFRALRELLVQISERNPLVIFIDDLQWGDSDSAVMLSELLRPPVTPRVLLIVAYRAEYARQSVCVDVLRAFAEESGRETDWDIEVGALTEHESRDLANALLRDNADEQSAIAMYIAQESKGTPYFIFELAQHIRAGHDLQDFTASPGFELGDVLWNRVQELPETARRLLEVLAVAGQPIRLRNALEAALLETKEYSALAYLRSGHFVHAEGPSLDHEVGIYHDQIRETVVERITADQRRVYHAGLAESLVACPGVDAEQVANHFYEAGQWGQAGQYFVLAADQAAQTLAFDRAARLYQLSLEIHSTDEAVERQVRSKLGDALANAGRGLEAASQYQRAIDGTNSDEALELERRAAYQYCISGHVDQGRSAMQRVLAHVGMRLPKTPKSALVSLLTSRLRLRLRGLRFRKRPANKVDPELLRRIDVIWSASAGLSMFDVLIGADFQTRNCLLALRSGEPFRVVRALAWEGAHTSNIGGSAWRRTEHLLRTAESLAKEVDDPYAQGIVTLSSGIADFTNGRWPNGYEKLQHAESVLRNNCTNVAWEVDTAQAFSSWCLLYMGQLFKMGQHAASQIQEAQQRGDRYAVTTLRAFAQPVSRLVDDDPDDGERIVRSALQEWTQSGFHVQHIIGLMCHTYLDLYRGRAESAWRRIHEQWPLAAKSNLLRVQVLRAFLTHLRARCELAMADAVKNGDAYLRRAEHDARRIKREKMVYCYPHAAHIEAAIAARRGDRRLALHLLDHTINGYQSAEMQLFAAVARRRKGELQGGADGKALVEEANRWMNEQNITAPDCMADAFGARINR